MIMNASRIWLLPSRTASGYRAMIQAEVMAIGSPNHSRADRHKKKTARPPAAAVRIKISIDRWASGLK